MKEICVDIRMAFHSGIGTYIRNIIPALASAYKLRLICPPGFIQEWPFLNQCELIYSSSPIYSLQEQIMLPCLIPSCDLFWVPHYNLPLAPLRAKKRMITLHDVYHLASGKTLGYHKRLYANFVIQRAVRVADGIVTVSAFSKGEIIKYTGVPESKISVIHLGVDHHHFKEIKNSSLLEEVKIKYRLPEHYFIYVGNLTPHKNIDRLLLAWDLVGKKHPAWKLLIVGKHHAKDRWLEPVLDSRPMLRQRAIFLGQVSDQDLPVLYHLAQAMIHPSLYEGFGLTPLEAMSCGCPAVVSHTASLPEVCGDAALYVDPYNIEDIATGMLRMIEESQLCLMMKKNGLAKSQQLTWDKTIDGHLAKLESLLRD